MSTRSRRNKSSQNDSDDDSQTETETSNCKTSQKMGTRLSAKREMSIEKNINKVFFQKILSKT